MAKPSNEQKILLNELRDFVIEVMTDMPEWAESNVEIMHSKRDQGGQL